MKDYKKMWEDLDKFVIEQLEKWGDKVYESNENMMKYLTFQRINKKMEEIETEAE